MDVERYVIVKPIHSNLTNRDFNRYWVLSAQNKVTDLPVEAIETISSGSGSVLPSRYHVVWNFTLEAYSVTISVVSQP